MIACNFGGYNSYFVLKGLTDEGICPVIIPRGRRILLLSLPRREIKFLDIYLFVPLPLQKLPDCFGIPNHQKGDFLHLMNRPEYQDYHGSMPPMHLWNPKQMSSKQREEFEPWYSEKICEDFVFHFKEELISYCMNDVEVLRLSMRFRQSSK